jgi:hypothetical protein
MNKRFVSIVLITNIVFSCYSTAKEEIRTNQNNQTDLFAKEIDNKQELEQSLKHAKEQAGKGIAEQEGLKSLNVTQDEVNNKITELNSINAYDLESAGRLQRAKEENHYYELLEVDHSAPGQTRHKQDMEQIANASGKLIAKLTEGLKDIGVDCKKTKGNKEVEPQYVIDTEQEHTSDITYTKIICEQPQNSYDCAQSLKLTCKQAGECDSGGIVKASVSSDMKFEYSYPYLTIGTIADNYWGGRCDAYDRVTKFQVRNKEEIKEFKIVQVGFDDYLWIKVNGHTIYVGPYNEGYVEPFFGNRYGPRVNTNRGQYLCDLEKNWNFNVDINLLPYLKEGENEIWMRVIVAGAGEGWMKIIAKQHCCMSWQEQWSEQCQIK